MALMPVEQAVAQPSKVGVTSATDGDPLGKPPTENERVLRIGIGVQANEIVTTHSNDRAHLVFLDGTSLTVGPNARLTIDKFVYDPNSKTGDLAITATQGVFRLVDGKISKNNPIIINTPSSTIGIRGGITMWSVNQKDTTAALLFGHNMSVTGSGVTQNAVRPGSVVNTNVGAPPSPPTLLPPGGLTSLVSALENPGSSSSVGSGSGGTGSGGGSGADQKAASSQHRHQLGFVASPGAAEPRPDAGPGWRRSADANQQCGRERRQQHQPCDQQSAERCAVPWRPLRCTLGLVTQRDSQSWHRFPRQGFLQ